MTDLVVVGLAYFEVFVPPHTRPPPGEEPGHGIRERRYPEPDGREVPPHGPDPILQDRRVLEDAHGVAADGHDQLQADA